MTRGVRDIGTVSRARIMAYVDALQIKIQRRILKTERTINSARLLVCGLFGQRSERFLHARGG